MKARLFTVALLFALFTAVPAWGAAPTVAATTSGTNGSGTNHTLNYPAGVSSGMGVLMCIGYSVNTSGTWPAGWSVTVATNTFGGGSVTIECRYRITDGTEAASITVTTGASARSAYRAYRITGAHASSAAEGNSTDGDGVTVANPPSVTASWGAEENLWFVAGVHQAETVITYPTNYTGNGVNQNTTAVGLATSWRTATAATEDPSAFTWGSGNHSVAATIVVRPTACQAGGMLLWGIGC
jgi:hypothetical protein